MAESASSHAGAIARSRGCVALSAMPRTAPIILAGALLLDPRLRDPTRLRVFDGGDSGPVFWERPTDLEP